MHALNNSLGLPLYGMPRFLVSDMRAACDAVLFASTFPDAEHVRPVLVDCELHMTSNGYLSYDILQMALLQKSRFNFANAPLHVDPDSLCAPWCVGAIAHTPGHWVALRFMPEQGRFWLLDSLHAPMLLDRAAYLAYVQTHKETRAIVHVQGLPIRGSAAPIEELLNLPLVSGVMCGTRDILPTLSALPVVMGEFGEAPMVSTAGDSNCVVEPLQHAPAIPDDIVCGLCDALRPCSFAVVTPRSPAIASPLRKCPRCGEDEVALAVFPE
jgi:hypothetical protein